MTLKLKKSEQLGGSFENYPTPAWVTRRLVESGAVDFSGEWLEPAVGDFAIVREIEASSRVVTSWQTGDIRDVDVPRELIGLLDGDLLTVECCDYLDGDPRPSRAQGAITNPPFSLAEKFLLRMREEAETVVLLLPMSWFGGDDRQPIFRSHRPDLILGVPNRINFIDNTIPSLCECVPRAPGEPDPEIKSRGNKHGLSSCRRCKGSGVLRATSPSTDHAWWIWRAGLARRTEFDWLPSTPLEQRTWRKPEAQAAPLKPPPQT